MQKKFLSEVLLDFYAISSVVHWQIYAALRVSASSVWEPAGVERWYLSWSWCSCTLGHPLGNLEQSRAQIWQCSQLSHLNPPLVLKFNAKHLCKKENNLGWDMPSAAIQWRLPLWKLYFPLQLLHTSLFGTCLRSLKCVHVSFVLFSQFLFFSALNTSSHPLFSPSHPHPQLLLSPTSGITEPLPQTI